MTWKWLLLIALSIVFSMWVVYGALHALNGIAYELRLMAARRDELE